MMDISKALTRYFVQPQKVKKSECDIAFFPVVFPPNRGKSLTKYRVTDKAQNRTTRHRNLFCITIECREAKTMSTYVLNHDNIGAEYGGICGLTRNDCVGSMIFPE